MTTTQTQHSPVLLAGDILLVREMALLLAEHRVPASALVDNPSHAAMLPPSCTPCERQSGSFQTAIELTVSEREPKRIRLGALEQFLPENGLLLSSSVVYTVAEQAHWVQVPGRLAGISVLPSQCSRALIEIALSIATTRSTVTAVEDFAIMVGKEVAIIQDRIGMVLPRIICALVNEAFFAVADGSAAAEDIDIAMKLGTNYPLGPVEWCSKIGIHNVIGILDALYHDTGEDRYRVAPLLRQIALNEGLPPAP